MVQVPPFESSLDHKERFVRVFSEADDRHKKIIAISLWSLWHRRNKLVHEGVKFFRQDILGFISCFERELNLNSVNIRFITGPAGKEIWRPLDDGFIKINFDASFVQDKGLAITAVLARNHKGEVVRLETYLLNDVVDTFVTEVGLVRGRWFLRIRWASNARIFEEITYTFVPREGNEAAHVLAIEGRRKEDCWNWATDVQDLVLTAVRKDWIAWVRKS
ncbi:hypothetical protein Golob_001545 [Gossypium lobatum]|uniref:RNase H type-1 domain-containing protein n=1 Tax=Gossypium lobatum TaxID=34289 RepID=A0A7J8NBI0_9ROSI|nr:hypothetical protein [Gossypium lobatum]